MSWQLAIAVSLVAGIATVLLQRRYAQSSKLHPTIPPAISYLLGVLPVGYVAGLFAFPHHISWSPWVVVLLLIEATSMAIAGWVGFATFSKLGVAPMQTIGRVATVTVTALGWIALGEQLTLAQSVGAAFLLAAALLAVWAPAAATTTRHLHVRYVTLACFGAAMTGVGLVTEKALLGHMQIGAVYLVGWTAQTLAMLALAAPAVYRQQSLLNRHEIIRSSAMGFANGLSGVFYVYAIFHANNISLVTAVQTIGLPLTVLAAFIFLREREHTRRMWTSLAISFLGLVILAM